VHLGSAARGRTESHHAKVGSGGSLQACGGAPAGATCGRQDEGSRVCTRGAHTRPVAALYTLTKPLKQRPLPEQARRPVQRGAREPGRSVCVEGGHAAGRRQRPRAVHLPRHGAVCAAFTQSAAFTATASVWVTKMWSRCLDETLHRQAERAEEGPSQCTVCTADLET